LEALHCHLALLLQQTLQAARGSILVLSLWIKAGAMAKQVGLRNRTSTNIHAIFIVASKGHDFKMSSRETDIGIVKLL
jgi:hypothetical protein